MAVQHYTHLIVVFVLTGLIYGVNLIPKSANAVYQPLITEDSDSTNSSKFKKFQFTYLTVCTLVSLSDFIQNPYYLDLMLSYGLSQAQAATLFGLGFLASAWLGTLVGSLGDRVGRKRICIIGCISSMTYCALGSWGNYYGLITGRVFSGIATGILWTNYEAWMVKSHQNRNFSQRSLADTFSKIGITFGCSGVASGLISDALVSWKGPVATFWGSFALSLAAILLMTFLWEENYGEEESNEARFNVIQWFQTLIKPFKENPKIFWLGLGQASFETGTFCFVFSWTAILKRATDAPINIEFGTIFTIMMTSFILATNCFQLITKWSSFNENYTLTVSTIFAALSLYLIGGADNHPVNHYITLSNQSTLLIQPIFRQR